MNRRRHGASQSCGSRSEHVGSFSPNRDSPLPAVSSAIAVARPRTGLSWWSAGLRVVWGALLVGVCAAAVGWSAHYYALRSPRFALRQTVVEGTHRISEATLLERAGVRLGQNIFSIDTQRLEQRLIVDPWIRTVKVERRLPALLRFEVEEREAGAIAVVGDRMLLLTKTGEPFKDVQPGDPIDLPMVTGLSGQGIGQKGSWERARIATALEVIRHYERTSLSRIHPAQEVHLNPGGETVLVVGRTGISLYLGSGPWGRKLAMAERVLDRLRRRNQVPSMVFLDNRTHPERVVVRLR